MSGQEEALQPKESSFVEGLAYQLGMTANARNIYGDPVERDGVTVIPVAQAAYGFGGGSGRGKKEHGEVAGEGSGGGGGAMLIPVGYIEIKNGQTRFRPTRDRLALVPAILAAAPLSLLMIWRITKLFRRKSS